MLVVDRVLLVEAYWDACDRSAVCLPGYLVGLVALLRERRRSFRARVWGRPSMVMSDRGNAMKDFFPAG
jgi:hypothetical protein